MNRLYAFCVLLGISACTTQQVNVASPMLAVENQHEFRLRESLSVRVSKASSVTLKEGTTWVLIGELKEGQVLKSNDQVVVINSFNVHEGYIVVLNRELIGFYLPVTKGFVETSPTQIELIPHHKE